jgi:hypothetical protein
MSFAMSLILAEELHSSHTLIRLVLPCAVGNCCLIGVRLTLPEEVNILGTPTKERWRELCEQIAVERDPDRFLAAIEELNQVLEQHGKKLCNLAPDHRATNSQDGREVLQRERFS